MCVGERERERERERGVASQMYVVGARILHTRKERGEIHLVYLDRFLCLTGM